MNYQDLAWLFPEERRSLELDERASPEATLVARKHLLAEGWSDVGWPGDEFTQLQHPATGTIEVGLSGTAVLYRKGGGLLFCPSLVDLIDEMGKA